MMRVCAARAAQADQMLDKPLLLVIARIVVPLFRTLRSDEQPARWKSRMNATIAYSASW